MFFSALGILVKVCVGEVYTIKLFTENLFKGAYQDLAVSIAAFLFWRCCGVWRLRCLSVCAGDRCCSCS